MAINLTRVTQGNAQRGWTAGSIAPVSGAFSANVPMSGNIPANIMQAIGNLTAQQAFQQFLGAQPQAQPQPVAVVSPPPNPAAVIQAQTEQAQQRAAQTAAALAQQRLGVINQNLLNYPTGFGGISPMGLGAPRAAMQQQQFDLQNQLAAANAAAFGAPRMSGWVGGF